MKEPAAGALAGIKVIDLTAIVMGPLATQFLADLGADVIKIEPPTGDILRPVGAPEGADMGPLFVHLNRGKRSVVLDLKEAAARADLMDLIRGADVIAHSMRPGAMARLGLSYADVRAIRPDIIYAGMFGFSQNGPYAEDAAFDDLIQAMSGLTDLMGRTSDGRPRYVPCNLADRTVGMLAFGAICAALFARERTGEGCEIGIPMFETLASLVLGDHMYGKTCIPDHAAMGYPRLLVRNRGPFPTSDGHICAMIYTNGQWQTFLRLIGESGTLAADPRLADIGARTRHADDLFEMISAHTRRKPTAQWLELMKAAGLPAVAMRRVEDLLDDPHLTATGFFEHHEDPALGQVRLMRSPLDMPALQAGARGLPPRLGAHTQEILSATTDRIHGSKA